MRADGVRTALGAIGTAACIGLAACGSAARQDASEPSGNFAVEVQSASFPAAQRLSQHTHLRITVRNADQKTIPDIAVTLTTPGLGTSVAPFAYRLDSPSLTLASHSRAVWIVDHGPDPSGCGYSCQEGSGGGAVTASANTWALGPLKPGATATFDWAVTAVHTGTHAVAYRVAAGLNGKAQAVAVGGGAPAGTFTVSIAHTAQQAYVDDNGHVVAR